MLIALLRGYKWALSPLFPPACRFTPTCSEYAMEAIDLHGALVGSLFALWRLLRCHPFARAGYDPVPHQHWFAGRHATLAAPHGGKGSTI